MVAVNLVRDRVLVSYSVEKLVHLREMHMMKEGKVMLSNNNIDILLTRISSALSFSCCAGGYSKRDLCKSEGSDP